VKELLAKIKELASKITKATAKLELEAKAQKLEELKQQMSAADFWQAPTKAKAISTQASNWEEEINIWHNLEKKLADLKSLAKDKQALDLLPELEKNYGDLLQEYDDLAQQLLLAGKYDAQSAILTINAGAGGVEAQDWAAMLERMYLRFAEQNKWAVKYLAKSAGAEAGLKSTTFEVNGQWAYGYLKNEAGVHRLVRLSPFDADHARHTSFAMVEILPVLAKVDFLIKESDLKIETFRASGHGGQSVNKSDSAVRLIHLPTGLSAGCQNERSQLQNKKQALIYLQSKVQIYYEAAKEEERRILRGEYTTAAWGNQIRSYVLHPYKMVKDHRTDLVINDPNKVLDGEIMSFIKANLERNIKA
jgi:peptide chain release factor 2